jgi:HD-GYP domain-containing protein (c-di-GMP phosphodiesterase class II)
LASQAAVSITNAKLVTDLENLLNSIIRTIATAIDEKSPYTGGHIKRVATVALLLANAVSDSDKGIFKNIKYDKSALEQIKISAWLHDIGKIATPDHIMDKSTKLETIFDRIELVETRFEILRRDLKISYLTKKTKFLEEGSSAKLTMLDERYKKELKTLRDDIEFLRNANIGGEFMSDDKIERVKEIGKRRLVLGGKKSYLLTDNEIENLCIRKGTLTNKERDNINEHADISIKMLEQLPFPKKLRRVPEIAGGHHEKINGKGYPKGLCGAELTTEARILAIADVFEALTAPDRPYKDPKKLSEVAKILGFMAKDEELDRDLLKLFFENNLYLEYAKNELREEQIDKVEINF